MYTNEQKEQINEILKNITDELDISETKFKEAESRYKAVGNWLSREVSILKDYNPQIYPQGSFNLGTMIKPVSDKDEYDIDLVCELEYKKNEISQKELKERVGIEICSYAEKNIMNKKPENNSRCWTLDYANEFHMDILPAIPNSDFFKILLESKGLNADYTDDAIAITDKNHNNYNIISDDWLGSNPKGYLKWFKDIMKLIFFVRKGILAKALNEDIEDIPDYKVKTPLQRTIQLLKRHRDIYFNGKSNKPISIIITTLAGQSYSNEPDIYDALMNITSKIGSIDSYIVNGEYQILNPVNPDENFADKWNYNRDLPNAFQDWIIKVRTDFIDIVKYKGIHKIAESLYPLYGENLTKSAIKSLGDSYYHQRKSNKLRMAVGTGTLISTGTKIVKDHTFYGK